MTVVLWPAPSSGSATRAPTSGRAAASAASPWASLVLGAIVLARRERLVPRDDLPGLIVCRLLWFAVYNVALNEAELRWTWGPRRCSNIGPVLIALLAGQLLGEGFPRILTGCALAFAGVVDRPRHLVGGTDSELGHRALPGRRLTYAGGVIAQEPLLEHSSALAVTWPACCVATLACLTFALALGTSSATPRPPRSPGWSTSASS